MSISFTIFWHAGSASAGLIAYYPFSGNANDASGNGNNGTVSGATLTNDRFGNPNSAYFFNGTNAFIFGNASSFPTGARTIDLWFNAATTSTHPVFLGYGGGLCGTSFFIGVNSTPTPNAYYVDSHCATPNSLLSPPAPNPSGQWHNFAVTTDASGTFLYLDGLQIASNASLFLTNTLVAGTQFAIGVDVSLFGTAPYTDVNVGYFQGVIDEVRIYNNALSAQEIAQLAATPATPTGVPEPSTLALFGVGLASLIAMRRRRKTA